MTNRNDDFWVQKPVFAIGIEFINELLVNLMNLGKYVGKKADASWVSVIKMDLDGS